MFNDWSKCFCEGNFKSYNSSLSAFTPNISWSNKSQEMCTSGLQPAIQEMCECVLFTPQLCVNWAVKCAWTWGHGVDLEILCPWGKKREHRIESKCTLEKDSYSQCFIVALFICEIIYYFLVVVYFDASVWKWIKVYIFHKV